MKTLTKWGHPYKTSEEEIYFLGSKIGQDIPADLKEVILKYAGNRVKEALFEERYFLDSFLEIKSEVNISITSVLEVLISEMNQEIWLPFAVDQGGWAFLYSIAPETFGQIWIFKAGIGEDDPFYFVASSLEDFVNGLEEEG